MCVCLCLYILSSIQFYHLCSFVYPPPQSRSWTFTSPWGSLMFFYNHTHLPTSHSCSLCQHHNPWQLLIFLYFDGFVISRILGKWNHMVCDLWYWFYLLSVILCRFIQIVACIKSSFLFFYCWEEFFGIDIPQFV